jgi:starvation-inducible DNA-binding protein
MSRSPRSGSARRASTPVHATAKAARDEARPITNQRGHEIQAFGTITRIPNGLSEKVCKASVSALNQVLADTMCLRDLYKKHHWQVSGHTFYSLHLLFDKHYEEQATLVDTIAERIQLLGGLAIAMAPDVAELTKIERPPKGREEVPVQISRILEAHELICKEARDFAGKADEAGDDGTNDLLVSDVLRLNEMQAWFVAEHVVDTPLVRAD